MLELISSLEKDVVNQEVLGSGSLNANQSCFLVWPNPSIGVVITLTLALLLSINRLLLKRSVFH